MNSFKPKQQPVLAAANIRPFSFLASFFLSFFLTLFKDTNFQGFTCQINRHVTGTRLLYQFIKILNLPVGGQKWLCKPFANQKY